MPRVVSIAIALAGMIGVADARTADLPGLPFCWDDRGWYAEIQDHGAQGSWALFRYRSDRPDSNDEVMMLADCASGQAIRAAARTPEQSLFDAYYVMRDALLDSKTHSMGSIIDSLRGKGFRAERAGWSASHCVCKLAVEVQK